MMKNIDCTILINREIDDTDLDSTGEGKQYLGFKLEKYRGKPNKERIYVFLHPFDENNGILLTPDIDGKPLSRTRIEDFNPLNNGALVSSGKPSFDDYDKDSNEFITSLKSIIGDDYTDSAENYIEVCKNADEEVSSKLKKVQQADKDLRERRKRELNKFKNDNFEHKDGRLVMHRIPKISLEMTDDNRVIVRRQK